MKVLNCNFEELSHDELLSNYGGIAPAAAAVFWFITGAVGSGIVHDLLWNYGDTAAKYRSGAAAAHEELVEIAGGLSNMWEVIGYLFTSHGREMMYSGNSPSVLAYK